MLRRITLAAGVAAVLWGLLILLAHGGQVQFLGLKLSSRHPLWLFWGGVGLIGIYASRSRLPVPAFASLSMRQASLATAVVAVLAGAASVHFGSTVDGVAD